jgi:N-acyl-D-aspartate/D-glutamate deacylase
VAYDIVIRNGTIVDGSGAPGYRSDVAIKDGKIAGFGRIRDAAKEVIDADGLVVAPGFVDGHTHMDAQIFWDPLGTGSCWHGVTSVIMGNCGFSLAPCHPHEKESLMRGLEAVEDIPTPAMIAGIPWTWGTYRDYLRAIGDTPKGINYGGYVGHTALRRFVMGERAFTEAATPEDVEAMRSELSDGLHAGAMGFSTSRGSAHITPEGKPVPSRLAKWDEVVSLVEVMGDLNAGIFEIAGEGGGSPEDQRDYRDRVKDLAVRTGVTVTYGSLYSRRNPGGTKEALDFLDEVAAAGGRAIGQAHTRAINTVWSFKARMPYDRIPVWDELRAKPLEEQKVLLRDPELRKRLIHSAHNVQGFMVLPGQPRPPDREGYELVSVLVDMEGPNPSIAEVARQQGKDPVEVVIDLSLEKDFEQYFLQPIANESEDGVLAHMKHPRTVVTFSDSGAHVGAIVDCSLQTNLLGYWVRKKGAFTLEQAVRRITFDTASAWNLYDRGLLRQGLNADVTIFDPATVGAEMPEVAHDLPAGEMRLITRAKGIHTTIVNGQVLLRDGKHTGALPGELILGPLAKR